jgi:hypothetical protein
MSLQTLFRSYVLTFACLCGVILWAGQAQARNIYGQTFTCFFPKSGKVVIDTREPNSSITFKGRRYKASGGSYFYQTEAGITVGFNPSMTKWTLMLFGKYGTKSEKSTRCTKVNNKR